MQQTLLKPKRTNQLDDASYFYVIYYYFRLCTKIPASQRPTQYIFCSIHQFNIHFVHPLSKRSYGNK